MSSIRPRLLALGAALALATAVGGSPVAAQPPAGGQPQAGAQDNARPGGRGARDARRGMRGAQRAGRALFRDITLTEAQRTQVRSIHEKYAGQRRTLHEEARARWQQARPADRPAAGGQRPDSAQRAEFRAGRDAFRARVQALVEAETRELRGVLTGEQQATFDRNLAQIRERMGARQTRGEGRARREHGGRGHGAAGQRPGAERADR